MARTKPSGATRFSIQEATRCMIWPRAASSLASTSTAAAGSSDRESGATGATVRGTRRARPARGLQRGEHEHGGAREQRQVEQGVEDPGGEHPVEHLHHVEGGG